MFMNQNPEDMETIESEKLLCFVETVGAKIDAAVTSDPRNSFGYFVTTCDGSIKNLSIDDSYVDGVLNGNMNNESVCAMFYRPTKRSL